MLQWARDAHAGIAGKGLQTHFHPAPPQRGGDGRAPGLTHASGPHPPEQEARTHPPPASARDLQR